MPSILELLAQKKASSLVEKEISLPKAGSFSPSLVVPIFFLYLRTDIDFVEYKLLAQSLNCFPSTGSLPAPVSSLLSSSLFSLYLNRHDVYSAMFKLNYKLAGIGSLLSAKEQLELIPLIEQEKEKGYGNTYNRSRE